MNITMRATLQQRLLAARMRSALPSRSISSRPICLLCRHSPLSNPTQRSFTSRPSYAYADKSNSTNLISPDITNHYTLFPATLPSGPPPQSPFTINTASLKREFLSLQSTIHPDKYPQGPDKQRAEALSARINDAYRTLTDPLSRAQYLLAEFHGIDVLAEDGNTKYAGALDTDTLMEIMDVQEAVEDLSRAPRAVAEATVDQLRKENAARVRASLHKLSGAFDAGDIETAQVETVRLRFWYSLRDGLREWEHGHGQIRIVH
jgi:molecular chaperone HscB